MQGERLLEDTEEWRRLYHETVQPTGSMDDYFIMINLLLFFHRHIIWLILVIDVRQFKYYLSLMNGFNILIQWMCYL
jgi:hypothetical protein